ncbi:MAG: multicopper oxidase family protein [Chloroflexota bacterium]
MSDPTTTSSTQGVIERTLTRRGLLRAGAITGGGIIASTIVACTTPAAGGGAAVSSGVPTPPAAGSATPPRPGSAAPSASAPAASHEAGHSAEPSTAPSGSPTAADHDANAKAVVDRFLAGEGAKLAPVSPPLAPRLEGGVKVFELTIDEIKHQIDGVKPPLDALGFNAMWPGPRIEVDEGDRVRAIFTNNLSEPTGIHFHGQRLPNAMDGVPHITQQPIHPGASFTYEFTAKTTGSHMYHSHHNATDQVGRGLLGAFIVQPKDRSERYDVRYGATQDIVWISNDTLGGFTINGRGFPATEPIVAKLGDTIVVRFMNEGQMTHPWHLHGVPMRVVARDGYPLGAAAFTCDTLGVNPGERWDVVIECDEPGAWAFHCHVLSHAEGQDGMYGMVTALVVQDAAAATVLQQAGAPAFECVIPSQA